MRERSYRNVIYSGFRVIAHILQPNAAGSFHRNMPGMPGNANYSLADILHLHVVQQDALSTVGQSFLQLGQRAHFNFDGLLLAAVAQRSLESGRSEERRV